MLKYVFVSLNSPSAGEPAGLGSNQVRVTAGFRARCSVYGSRYAKLPRHMHGICVPGGRAYSVPHRQGRPGRSLVPVDLDIPRIRDLWRTGEKVVTLFTPTFSAA